MLFKLNNVEAASVVACCLFSSVFNNAMVTCETKLFWNNFEIISVSYFTCNHHQWLVVTCEIKHWNVYSFRSYHVDTQTRPQTHKQMPPKHPMFFATLRRWVITSLYIQPQTVASSMLPSLVQQASSYSLCSLSVRSFILTQLFSIAIL